MIPWKWHSTPYEPLPPVAFDVNSILIHQSINCICIPVHTVLLYFCLFCLSCNWSSKLRFLQFNRPTKYCFTFDAPHLPGDSGNDCVTLSINPHATDNESTYLSEPYFSAWSGFRLLLSPQFTPRMITSRLAIHSHPFIFQHAFTSSCCSVAFKSKKLVSVVFTSRQ